MYLFESFIGVSFCPGPLILESARRSTAAGFPPDRSRLLSEGLAGVRRDTRSRGSSGISGSRGSFVIPRPRGGVWGYRSAHALTCDRKSLQKFTIFFHLRAACRKPGISDFRFHDLRYAAATYIVIGGIGLITVKEILGHATIQMTMRYAHPTPENKRQAVEVLAALFDESGQSAAKTQPQSQTHNHMTIPSDACQRNEEIS